MPSIFGDIQRRLERELDDATRDYPDGRVPADDLVADSRTSRR